MRSRNTYQERKHHIAEHVHEADLPVAETGLIARDLLEKAVYGLPENQRTALILKEVEGMSCLNIAESMGTTPENVRVLIHRARKTMIKFLRQNRGDTNS